MSDPLAYFITFTPYGCPGCVSPRIEPSSPTNARRRRPDRVTPILDPTVREAE